MCNKKLVFLLILMTTIFSISAEDKKLIVDRYPNALGGQLITNYVDTILGGLSYQRWMGKLGTQILAGALVKDTGDYWYTLTGALQYRLFSSDFAEWYSGCLYLNGLLGHSASSELPYSEEEPENANAIHFIPKVHVGFGIGIENIFLGHLSYALEFMYLANYNFVPLNANPLTLGFAVGTSLRYRY